MIYPLAILSTLLGRFRRCPHCGRLQAVKNEHARPICKKCGRGMAATVPKKKTF